MDFKGTIKNNKVEIDCHESISSMLVPLEGEEIIISLKKNKKLKSAAQVRWYFGIAISLHIIPFLKEATGEHYTKSEIHHYHLSEIVKPKFSTKEINGKTIVMMEDISVKTMTTVQFNNFKERVQLFWATKGLDIPDPINQNFINEHVG